MRQVFDVVEANVENLNASLKMFKSRLEALELRDRLSDSMINAMQTAVKVQEDQLGQELKSKIVDMEDMDHM